MDWTAIIVTAITALGAGGIGAAIVSAISNKGKITEEALATKLDAQGRSYESMMQTAAKQAEITQNLLLMAQEQMSSLQARMDRLEADIAGRDMTIKELKDENVRLQCEVDELGKQNRSKDKRIRELSELLHEQEKRIHKLEERLHGYGDAG